VAYIDTYNAVIMGGQIRARACVAVAKYAQYIVAEPGNTANHANRLAWAKAALETEGGVEGEVSALKWAIAADPWVQTYLDDFSDPDLQTLVETLVNQLRIAPAS
jgi:hypothetical protein